MYIFQHRNFAKKTTSENLSKKASNIEEDNAKSKQNNRQPKKRESFATRSQCHTYNASCVLSSVFFSFPLGVYKCSAVCIFYIIFQWMFCFKFNILFACRVGALFFSVLSVCSMILLSFFRHMCVCGYLYEIGWSHSIE